MMMMATDSVSDHDSDYTDVTDVTDEEMQEGGGSDEGEEEEELAPLDDLLCTRLEDNETQPILTNVLFREYAKRIPELHPDVQTALADPTISDRKKIKLAELQLLVLSSDPTSYDYVELRNVLNTTLKTIRLKTALKAQRESVRQECVRTNISPTTNLQDVTNRLSLLPSSDSLALAEMHGKIRELFKLDKSDTEYGKLCSWVNSALSLIEVLSGPSRLSIDRNALLAIRDNMNERLYGIEHIKNNVLMFLVEQTQSKHLKTVAPVLGLVGPQGIGKTTIATVMAQALGCGLTVIPAAGMRDSTIITGHSYTYIGSQPGVIASAILRYGVRHVVLIDELDKASNQVQHALLHVLDPTTNTKYTDHYFGTNITMDLSQLIFIVTSNSLVDMPRPLVDRMHVCKMRDYTRTEKIRILVDFVAPSSGTVITDDLASRILNIIPDSPGIRPYANVLKNICQMNKLNAVLDNIPIENRLVVTDTMIEDYATSQLSDNEDVAANLKHIYI